LLPKGQNTQSSLLDHAVAIPAPKLLRLVTLSACDTGSGEARAGEGVLGLRRGFIEAGTQNLLMTLSPLL